MPEATKSGRGLEVWFFPKALNGQRLDGAGLDLLREFNVAVACFGPARLNPQNRDLALLRCFEGRPDQSQIAGRPGNQMVGWKDSEDRAGLERMQDMSGETDGGSGVALRGLREDLLFGNFRKLLNDFAPQMIVGENPDSFGRQHRFQPVHGLLNQGAIAHETEDLLGVFSSATRPKARTAASGENQPVAIGFRH